MVPYQLRYLDITILYMEQFYLRQQNKCKLVKVKPERVQLLLQYSKALNIINHKGLKFENNLN